MSDQDRYKQTLDQYNDPLYAKKYASNIVYFIDKWQFDEFLKFVKPGAKILDAGCAAGRDTNYFHSLGYDVTGIDISNELIKLAKKNYPAINFIQGDFLDLPFENEVFDAVWCKAGLVHMPSQKIVEDSLTEFARILKINGYLMLLAKTYDLGAPDTMVRTDSLSGKNRYFRYQRPDKLAELFNSLGLKVTKSIEFNEGETKSGALRNENWVLMIASKKNG